MDRCRSLALAVFVLATAHAVAAPVPPGIIILGTPSPSAAPPVQRTQTVRPKLPTVTVDADAAGREPFLFSTYLTTTTGFVTVPIPAGYRLIIEEVNTIADTGGAAGAIQPFVVLDTTVGSTNALLFYALTQSQTLAGQYGSDFVTKAYADSLQVVEAMSGATANAYFDVTVTISGHLIADTAP
jgi:hypothetical protein